MPIVSYNHASYEMVYNSQAWSTRHLKQKSANDPHTEWVLDVLDKGTVKTVMVCKSLRTLLDLTNGYLELRFEDEQDLVFYDMCELGK